MGNSNLPPGVTQGMIDAHFDPPNPIEDGFMKSPEWEGLSGIEQATFQDLLEAPGLANSDFDLQDRRWAVLNALVEWGIKYGASQERENAEIGRMLAEEPVD